MGSGPRRARGPAGAAGDQFHGDDGHAPNLLRAENIDAVGMVDGSGQAALAEETLARVGRIKGVAEHLEGHAATVFRVLGFIARAHAARRPGRMMA